MRRLLLMAAFVLAAIPASGQVSSDTRPSSAALRATAQEWTVAGGAAWGVEVFHSEPNHDFAFNAVTWGRVFTAPRGPGVLRGRFQWAMEIVPVFGQYEPRKVYGVGLTPIVWRWNFEGRGRVLPYVELGGGALWTTDPVPERTTTSNFTAHLAIGTRILTSARQGLMVAYRFHHISNGNRLERNPGVNSHQLYAGWTWIR